MSLAEVLRAVLGVPNYERYLEHAKRAHPDQIPMTESEFCRVRLEEKYSRPGGRCC